VFDNNSTEINFDDEVDIMAVAGLLKLFLRELPDSLIPELMVKQFISVQASELIVFLVLHIYICVCTLYMVYVNIHMLYVNPEIESTFRSS